MAIDQKIIDKALDLNLAEIELIESSHDNDLYNDVSLKYGNLYHDLLEMCSLDYAIFNLYRVLAEFLHDENYDMAATIKTQIEMTEPLKQFVLDQELYRIQKGYH